jgi:hypothetical protein
LLQPLYSCVDLLLSLCPQSSNAVAISCLWRKDATGLSRDAIAARYVAVAFEPQTSCQQTLSHGRLLIWAAHFRWRQSEHDSKALPALILVVMKYFRPGVSFHEQVTDKAVQLCCQVCCISAAPLPELNVEVGLAVLALLLSRMRGEHAARTTVHESP